MELPTHKVCTKCGENKAIEEFSRHSSCKYGRRSRCRDCCHILEITRRAENSVRFKELRRASRVRNRSKELSTNRKYYAENRDKCLGRHKEYRVRHPERVIAMLRDKREHLTNAYVAHAMRISVKDAPPDLIETKRVNLMIYRFITRGASNE